MLSYTTVSLPCYLSYYSATLPTHFLHMTLSTIHYLTPFLGVMAALQVAFFFGIFVAFTSAALNPIQEHPHSVAVHLGQWANFSCGIKLPGTIRWRIGDFSVNGSLLLYHTSGNLHALNGVTAGRPFPPDIRGKILTETIGVLATAELDGVPVECMYGHPALASRNSYSKFALLEVRDSCVPKMLRVEVTLKKIRAAFKVEPMPQALCIYLSITSCVSIPVDMLPTN